VSSSIPYLYRYAGFQHLIYIGMQVREQNGMFYSLQLVRLLVFKSAQGKEKTNSKDGAGPGPT
jgi:hypothetical protein